MQPINQEPVAYMRPYEVARLAQKISRYSADKLTSNAKLVFLAMCRMSNKRSFCYPGIDRLSAELGGVSGSTIKRGVDDLVKEGFLEKDQRGQGETNRYDFIYHPVFEGAKIYSKDPDNEKQLRRMARKSLKDKDLSKSTIPKNQQLADISTSGQNDRSGSFKMTDLDGSKRTIQTGQNELSVIRKSLELNLDLLPESSEPSRTLPSSTQANSEPSPRNIFQVPDPPQVQNQSTSPSSGNVTSPSPQGAESEKDPGADISENITSDNDIDSSNNVGIDMDDVWRRYRQAACLKQGPRNKLKKILDECSQTPAQAMTILERFLASDKEAEKGYPVERFAGWLRTERNSGSKSGPGRSGNLPRPATPPQDQKPAPAPAKATPVAKFDVMPEGIEIWNQAVPESHQILIWQTGSTLDVNYRNRMEEPQMFKTWAQMCKKAGDAIRQPGSKWVPNLDWILKDPANYVKVANGGCSFNAGSAAAGSRSQPTAGGYWMEGKEYVSIDRSGKEFRSEVFKTNPLDHD